MLHSIEDLIKKINAMHDTAVMLHRARNQYSDMAGEQYDRTHCQHLLDQIQAMALEIAADREGTEIKTDMEYDKK